MTLRKISGTTPSRRFMTNLSFAELTKKVPEAGLLTILPKKSGRNRKVSVRGKGGRAKRFWRQIDFKRDKKDLAGRVAAIEYDPNRRVFITLVVYPDGEKRYLLAPQILKVGDEVLAGENVEVKVGNALPLSKIPVGTIVHNLELQPGKGGQIGRSAGTGTAILAKENGFVQVKLPSGEIRRVPSQCLATIGQLGNLDWKNVTLGKAGRSRHLGRRPKVRGVAQNPRSHPHGGGEGRSGIGMSTPKTFAGRPAVGKTRKKKKYSDKYIIKRRK